VLLPESNGAPFRAEEPARYADHAFEELLRRFRSRGEPRELVLKLAGGAMVLGREHSQRFKIGERNAEAIYRQLERLGLRPAAVDLGGTAGRTLELHIATGKSYVRTATTPAREL
jgi:chemotaxis protein CheD